MTTPVKFTCTLGTTDPTAALGVEIWLDDLQMFNSNHLLNSIKIEHEFDDTDGEHELHFILKNKTQDHTQIDGTGAIIKDACITLTDFYFDDILLNHRATEQLVYLHSGNDPAATMVEQAFYGTMGCNGHLIFRFTSPIYIWLLEYM